MNLVIAESLAPAPVDEHQRIVALPSLEGRCTDQHMAARVSRSGRNSLHAAFNIAARKPAEIDVVPRERAFGKKDRITAGTCGLRHDAANALDVLRDGGMRIELRGADLNGFRHTPSRDRISLLL